MDGGFVLIVAIALAGGVFTFCEFIDLMGRYDDEFPGRYDKPIWAAAILIGTVFGAFAYWLTKPPAPSSNAILRHEFEIPPKQEQ